MMIRRRKIITIENHKQTVIRPLNNSLIAHCDFCGMEVLMLSPEEAAILIHTSACEIYRLIEEDRLHINETPFGKLLICSNSLSGCNS